MGSEINEHMSHIKSWLRKELKENNPSSESDFLKSIAFVMQKGTPREKANLTQHLLKHDVKAKTTTYLIAVGLEKLRPNQFDIFMTEGVESRKLKSCLQEIRTIISLEEREYKKEIEEERQQRPR